MFHRRSLQVSARVGAAAMALSAGLCAPAGAEDGEPPSVPLHANDASEPGIDLAAPAAAPLRLDRIEPRLWLERGPATMDLRPAQPTMWLGVGYRVGERSSLVVNTGLGPWPERRRGWGLAYEASTRPSAAWARGTLLRLQLDGGSSLSLRLRGGRVGVTWRAQF